MDSLLSPQPVQSPVVAALAPVTSDQRQETIITDPPITDVAITNLSWRPLYWFAGLLALDLLSSLVFLLPIFHPIEQYENIDPSQPFHYSWHGSLWDLAVLASFRIISAILALVLAYYYPRLVSSNSTDGATSTIEDEPHLYHPNGNRKTKDELEQEALEESCGTKVKRHVQRYSFGCELVVLVTGILLSIKSMARLNVEIGLYDEAKPEHPLFWLALAMTGVWALMECAYMESMELFVGDMAVLEQRRRRQRQQQQQTGDDDPSSLTEPLLSATLVENESTNNSDTATNNSTPSAPRQRRSPHGKKALTEIDYKSTWADIVEFVLPDRCWVSLATVFLFAAAVCNVFIPYYTGNILDALVDDNNDGGNGLYTLFTTNDNHDDSSTPLHGSIVNIPGFVTNIKMLVLVSILGGVFAGVRGAIFSTVGARCNARLRIQLMDSLLCQDIGFYDTTRTGDITSRLSSDTTLVGSAVTNNVNVFLRSVVRVVGVLIFMCFISWQLTILAFLTIPAVSVLSKWYGRYVRKLSKAQQKKLADGNNVSECVISSMATVRSFGAERIEMHEFEKCMDDFLQFNLRSAVATFGYQTVVGALPQLVKALVLFYGGLLVQSERNPMTGGQLITFVLYLSTLAESFNSLGGIYASLSRALGASEKVFALMHRKPRRTIPKREDGISARAQNYSTSSGNNGIPTERDIEQQQRRPLVEETSHESPAANNEQEIEDGDHAQAKNVWKMLFSPNTTKQSKVLETYARGLNPNEVDLSSPVISQGGGEISFRNVEARYPARPDRVVLDGLDLTIPAGSVCALVGSSGSGKSSIVKLIQNLYEPTKGKVCINGVDVRQLSPKWMAQHVAVVSQEPVLFARSVRDNIVYGLEYGDGCNRIPEEEIHKAARLANAHSFIEKLPQGYYTEVGERGIQLSGGQRQRCAIARAIVRQPLLLLLDEATAALDSESEFAVQEAIDDMISQQRVDLLKRDLQPQQMNSKKAPMTVLMIAHRLSTVRNADIIFVVENGKVAEQGSHAELIAKEDGVYKALVSRQMSPN